MFLESLESRRLMSGTVTVTLDPATLQLSIVGDNKSNQVVITSEGDFLVLKGTDGTTIKGGTTINGGTFVPSKVRGIKFDMGNGDDSVRFEPVLPVIAPVQVTTGNGDDTVILKESLGFGDLNVSTGNGNDHVEIDEVGIESRGVAIDTGNGDDSIAIDTLIYFAVTIDGGHGADVLSGLGNIQIYPGGTLTIIDVETIS